MAARVNIDIQAGTQGVKRELSALERFMDGVSKRMGALFQKGGSSQAVTGMTKQMAALTKQTEQQVAKVNMLAEALRNVSQQMRNLNQGSPQYASLQKQQQLMQRNFQNANTRLGTLQQMQAAGASQMAAQPQQQAGAGAQLLGRMGSIGQLVPELAMKFLPGIAGILTVTGIATVIKHAFDESSKTQKTLADVLPRIVGVGAAGKYQDLDKQISGFGRGLGYSRNEGLSIAETLSKGGVRSVGGLKADTQTTMQFARMFGVDAGQQATYSAEAGRMGAYKPGEARKFAQMMAQEIAHTGLGPRVEEVQEATLMLLNKQLENQASANPTSVMALQTLFNKTGLPAFTGARGASTINDISGRLSNPGSDAARAVMQSVHMRLGAKGIFDMERRMERGISDPKVLPELIRMVTSQTKNSDEAKFILKQMTGLSMLKLDALDKAMPGGLKGLTAARMRGAEGILKASDADLAAGAKKAMGLTGNKLRFGEATMDDVVHRLGDLIVHGVGELAERLAGGVDGVLKLIDDNTKTAADKLVAIADVLVGSPVDKMTGGALSDPNNWKTGIKGAVGMIPGFGSTALGGAIADKVFPDPSVPSLGLKGLAASMGLSMTSGYRSPSRNRAVRGAKHSHHMKGSVADPGAFDFGGTEEQKSKFFDAVRQQFGDDAIRELIYSPKGMIKTGSFIDPSKMGDKVKAQHYSHVHVSLSGMGEGGGGSTLTIKVQHDGAISPHTQQQIDKHIDHAVEKKRRDMARTKPNRRSQKQ